MALSYKNRIASYYIFTTAFLVFGVFFLIFSMVKISVYNHVDQDIVAEVDKHVSEIKVAENSFALIHKNENFEIEVEYVGSKENLGENDTSE